jgi:hypothetical protein
MISAQPKRNLDPPILPKRISISSIGMEGFSIDNVLRLTTGNAGRLRILPSEIAFALNFMGISL